MREAPLLQQRALPHQRLWAAGEFFSSDSGFASCSSRWWHKVSALLQEQPELLPASLPLQSISLQREQLMLPPRPRCFWVACRDSGPCPGAVPAPSTRALLESPLRSRGGSQGCEGKSRQKPGGTRLRAPCALPSTQRPKPALGLNTPEPLKTRSFPSSFTYVNDDPQEVIVGERRELASLDLLNHFITGTRSEWPLSAGSASPSPSAFI